MSAHTPAPWELSAREDGEGHRVINRDGYVLALVAVRASSPWSGPKWKERDANAQLIAAAPELLDALRAFCGDYESTPTTSDTSLKAAYLHALEVIAKAEGRS